MGVDVAFFVRNHRRRKAGTRILQSCGKLRWRASRPLTLTEAIVGVQKERPQLAWGGVGAFRRRIPLRSDNGTLRS